MTTSSSSSSSSSSTSAPPPPGGGDDAAHRGVGEVGGVWAFHSPGAQRASEAYRALIGQPNWVVRAGLLAFGLVIAIPVIILVLFATFIAAIVFFIAAAAAKVAGLFKGSGRRNVRVIQRYEE